MYAFLLVCVTCHPMDRQDRLTYTIVFDTLLAGIYRFQNFGTAFICGDFNSRCGSNEDFIEGIDKIQEMEVINFTSNMYGDLLLDFLINSNMCMKNGRKCINNDFTSVSIKGLAVVDYCFVSHDVLHMFNKLIVIRASV